VATAITFDPCCVARHTGDAQDASLAEHIEWAAQNGALEAVARFLRELREEDWFHIGD
jgi:hypothetical protein